MNASVVIPTRDRCVSLLRSLEPLLRDRTAAQVIVVDDGSIDATAERLRALAAAHPDRLDLVHTQGAGPAYARQAGLELVRHPVVLFLEDDLVASEELVSRHLGHHLDRDALVVAGYSPIVPPRAFPANLIASLYSEEYERECSRWESGQVDVLSGLYGGHISLRTEHALTVGLCNPNFDEHYHEDQDFGLRCLQAGLVGCFDRTLLAWHHYERDLRSFERGAERMGAGMVRIHALHRETLGELEPRTLWSALPAPARLIVRSSRRPRARAATRVALRAYLSYFPGRGAARVALKMLRRIALLEGAARALRSSPPASAS